MNIKRDNVGCLTVVPADDGNFKCALGYATDEELNQALQILKKELSQGAKNKSRISACERELKKRNKARLS